MISHLIFIGAWWCQHVPMDLKLLLLENMEERYINEQLTIFFVKIFIHCTCSQNSFVGYFQSQEVILSFCSHIMYSDT